MERAYTGHRKGMTYFGTKNLQAHLHDDSPTAWIQVPILDTEISSRVGKYLVKKLETYGIVTFRQLLQCTRQFLRSTARLSKDKVEELKSFMWLISEAPMPLFPEETERNMKNMDFLESYPFNTKHFDPIYSVVDEVRGQATKAMGEA